MKILFTIMILSSFSSLAVAVPYVGSIVVMPENPDPGEPHVVVIRGDMPDGCWEAGVLTGFAFTLVDTYAPGLECTLALVPFEYVIDRPGVPEGVHSLMITEYHSSSRTPGTWTHEVVYDVGTPEVADEAPTWSALKALYR
jgi:hypothetical protein